MTIKLRQLEEKDAPFMYEWMSNPEINQFFRFDASNVSVESCLDYIHNSVSDDKNKHFAIVDDSDDEYLGTISLKNITDTDAEYAISTRMKAHGKNMALQATKQILSYAFNELDLEKVYLNVLTDNKRANAFYKKAGFILSHCEERSLTINGEEKDLNWYYLNRE